MHRFLISAPARTDALVALPPDEAKHAAQVLRLTVGTCVELLDGVGGTYSATLEKAGKDGVLARVVSALPSAEPRTQVTLYQGLAKGEKMDWIIQKCTELGVARVQPVLFSRSVAQGGHRTDRWQRIALEAAKQCGRGCVPRVEEPACLETLLPSLARHELCVAPWEQEHARSLPAALSPAKKDVGLVIGPEGGMDSAEMEAMIVAGAVPVSLGPRILRTETAAIASLTMILYTMGELECQP